MADHPAILHALSRLASRRGLPIGGVLGHCNALRAKGRARVERDRLARPQDWEALVQAVEAFDAETTADPCAGTGAVTWGGPLTDRVAIAAKEASGALVRVDCGETRNVFFRGGR